MVNWLSCGGLTNGTMSVFAAGLFALLVGRRMKRAAR